MIKQTLPSILCYLFLHISTACYPSLFKDPQYTQVQALLEQPCSKDIVQQAIQVLTPCQLIPFYYDEAPYQQIIFNLIIEKLLQRCDIIINNPVYNLAQPHTYKNIPILRPFNNFHPQSTELSFLKHYRFITKSQKATCFFPKNFESSQYFHSSTFDYFFEHSSFIENPDDLELVKNPLKMFRMQTIVCQLAHLADELEKTNLSHKNNLTNEPHQKKLRIETQRT